MSSVILCRKIINEFHKYIYFDYDKVHAQCNFAAACMIYVTELVAVT